MLIWILVILAIFILLGSVAVSPLLLCLLLILAIIYFAGNR